MYCIIYVLVLLNMVVFDLGQKWKKEKCENASSSTSFIQGKYPWGEFINLNSLFWTWILVFYPMFAIFGGRFCGWMTFSTWINVAVIQK